MPRSRALVVSALGDRAAALKALTRGAHGFLLKPFSEHEGSVGCSAQRGLLSHVLLLLDESDCCDGERYEAHLVVRMRQA